MVSTAPNGRDRRQPRRWTFGSCVFDEANWALVVRGRRVAVETKPLELLRELLLHAEDVVSKDELLHAIWPDVTVVEASLPTAVRKLRLALGNDRLIETVSGIGYRLTVPAVVEDLSVDTELEVVESNPSMPVARVAGASGYFLPQLISIAAGLMIVLAGIVMVMGSSEKAEATKAPIYTQTDAANAIRKLDVSTIERMLAAGWNPNAKFDKDGTDSMAYLLNICEWDPTHDQRQMMLLGRTLVDGGLDIRHRNFWGDTAYSIAKAKRYCGPDHPVTKMLKAICYNGLGAPGDRCLATYELTAAQRRAQGLPEV